MADIIKRQIIDKLSEYTKGLKPKDISLQFLSGKGELKTLELNPDFINRALMLPPWIEIHRVKCDSIKCKVPFTKLRSEPIAVNIREVLVQVRTCNLMEKREKQDLKALKSMQSSGKYGLIDRAIDGMSIVIRSIKVEFVDPTFEGHLILNDLSIYSTAPPGIKASSLKDMIIKMKEEDTVLIFKELKIQSLRIEASGRTEEHSSAVPLRLLVNETSIKLSLKRRIANSSILFAKVIMNLGDLMWILTQRQMKALSTFAQSLTETAIRAFHKEREEKAQQAAKKVTNIDPKASRSSAPSSSGSRSFFDPTDIPKVTEWLQKLYQEGGKKMPEWEIVQHSLHLMSHDINIQLCDDEASQDNIEGSTLLHLRGLAIDIYPDQNAGSGRCHWRERNEYIDGHLSWTREILSEVSKQKVAVSSSTQNSTPSSQGSGLRSASNSISGTGNSQDSPRNGRSSYSSMSSLHLESAHTNVSYTTTEMEDSDALVIETSIVDDVGLLKGNASWRGSSESLQSIDMPRSPEAVDFSKVRVGRLHERNIVVRCEYFSIDPLSTSDGKTSSLPFVQCDKETFSIPVNFPGFQMGLTLYYYPGHTRGKDHLVPRPVLQLNMCPIHVILHQRTCLWLVDFMRGILSTVDFNLANRVQKDIMNAVKRMKEKREAKYPMPTTLEGFFFKCSVMFTKITLPIYDEKDQPPEDGRPIAIQLETSEIRALTLVKDSLGDTEHFRDMTAFLKNGQLFTTVSSSTFPHCEDDLPFLSYKCFPSLLAGQGLGESTPHSPTGVIMNEPVGSGSPWHVGCNCITVQFVHTFKEAGLTSGTKSFIKDFPLSAWIFPNVTEFVESLSSGSEGSLTGEGSPTVTALIYVSNPVSAEVEKKEFLSLLRLKDSLMQFKNEILQRMIPMRDKIRGDVGEEDGKGPNVADQLYASGAVVVPGACFRMVLPPMPTGKTEGTTVEGAGIVTESSQENVEDTHEEVSQVETRGGVSQMETHGGVSPMETHGGVSQETHEGTLVLDPSGVSSQGNTDNEPLEEEVGVEAWLEEPDLDEPPPQPRGSARQHGPPTGHKPVAVDCSVGDCEQITFVANVKGIEAMFTARHKGITAKAGIHAVSVEEVEQRGQRAATPEVSPSELLHVIQHEPVVKLRADIGDIAEEYFTPSTENMPDGLVRLHIDGLCLDLVGKHMGAIQDFVEDEIPANNPIPLDIVVKNTKLSLLESSTADKEDPTSMNVVVGEVYVNRGPKPKSLYSKDVSGSVETLADEPFDPLPVHFETQSHEFTTVTTLSVESQSEESGLKDDSLAERGTTTQDESLLVTFRTFVEEFQSFISHPEQNLTSRTGEFMELLDGMRTSLAAAGVSGNRYPPPDYTTAIQVDSESSRNILSKLGNIEAENSQLQEKLKVLESECVCKEGQIRELEQALIDCKLELAQQKELVLEKDDNLKHLIIEMGRVNGPRQ